MFRLDDEWVFSASDLVGALRCEYQLLCKRAEKAGLVERLEEPADLVLERAATMGIAHEQAVLADLLVDHEVASIDQPDTASRAALEAAHQQTLEAFRSGVDVVYQAAFFHDGFHGLADFVVRTVADDGSVIYEPADTKLARHARVEALLQLASYADQLVAMGLPAPKHVHLWLGDGTTSTHAYADLQPILAERSQRMRDLLARPLEVPAWGDPTLRTCGRCAHCEAAEQATRDVLLVGGVRVDQRRHLVAAGITTIDDLAAATTCPEGMRASTFGKVHAQAVLQVAQDRTRTAADPLGQVHAELFDPAGIALVPEPNPGDVFFDFEGDPLHVEDGWPDLGLQYLFGIVTHDAAAPNGRAYWPIWAHRRAEEHRALVTFLDWLVARRATPGFEGLHVYHYAPYEVTALKQMVQRYGVRSEELDGLLRDGVFVDLYSVVRRSVRISERSYSIKRLEPLYMGDEYRDGDVTGGADSITWYADACVLRHRGELAQADEKLAALASYNEYDCVSTLKLRDWLLSLPGGARPTEGVVDDPGDGRDDSLRHVEALALADSLVRPFAAVERPDRTPDQQAIALLAAALLFHRREELPFWWNHFSRLAAPPESWEGDGDMIVLHPGDVTVAAHWAKNGNDRTFKRTLTALVDLPASSKIGAGNGAYAFYDPPVPEGARRSATSDRGYRGSVEITEIVAEGDRTRVTLVEGLPGSVADPGAPEHAALPVAISAGPGPATAPLATAILRLAQHALDADGALRPHPAFDLLARRPPRLVGAGSLPPVVGDGYADAIGEAVRALDRSYLAVQGPPGTGKTTKGAEVIRRLVDDGWKVGVVSQSHRTVESMLDQAIAAGLSPDRVGKLKGRGGDHGGRKLDDAALRAAVTEPGVGFLVGGTKWDLVNAKRVPADSLDLVVIDEAGQFALADTIAVSQAAPRLLLLGDPQQLPQVSQAVHPEPVATAALAWLAQGHDTLPPELGYFLGTTYRMHPELCAVSSRLSYDGKLFAAPVAAGRRLDGVDPGIRTVLVDHVDNTTASIEEAVAVVGLVRDLVGRTWTDEHGRRELAARDVLVVAPYNAHVNLVRHRLDDAGFTDTKVGTVDKFQGSQAPIVIMSLASSTASSSRGAGFVLSRNRLNVAISRAQHTAFLVHAPQLTDIVPATPDSLAQLGAFLGVSRAGRR